MHHIVFDWLVRSKLFSSQSYKKMGVDMCVDVWCVDAILGWCIQLHCYDQTVPSLRIQTSNSLEAWIQDIGSSPQW